MNIRQNSNAPEIKKNVLLLIWFAIFTSMVILSILTFSEIVKFQKDKALNEILVYILMAKMTIFACLSLFFGNGAKKKFKEKSQMTDPSNAAGVWAILSFAFSEAFLIIAFVLNILGYDPEKQELPFFFGFAFLLIIINSPIFYPKEKQAFQVKS